VSDGADFLIPFVAALTEAFTPLEKGFSSKQELEAFLFRYGWDVDVDGGQLDTINVAFAVAPMLDALIDNFDELTGDDGEARIRAALDLLEQLKNLIEHVSALAPGGIGALSPPFNQGAFWSELSGILFEEILVEYLRRYQGAIFAILHVIGAIRFERVTPAGAMRVPFTRSRIDWGQLGTFFAGPNDALNDLYAWNKAGQDLDHGALLGVIERGLHAFGVRAELQPPRPSLAAPLLHSATIAAGTSELELPIVDGIAAADQSYWKIGLVAVPVTNPVKTNVVPTGLAIAPILQGELSARSYFGHDVYLQLTGAFDADRAIVLRVYPNEVVLDGALGETVIEATMALVGAPQEPWILLGGRESSRFELGGFHASYGIRGRVDDLESIISFGTSAPGDQPPKKMRLVIQLGGADSFVNSLSGSNDVTVEVGGTLTWSSKHGFALEGQAGFQLAIPLHREIGPVEITTLYVTLAGRTRDGAALVDGDFGVGIVGRLGPLTAVLENIGLRASLKPLPAGKGGAGGTADFAVGFKPPDGVGLAIDAGVVEGGGYLRFDEDEGEYAGALELTVGDFLSLKAIGLISTKLPGGQPGFSLLIIITAEFSPGIQLGFGFSLTGVGGLLALNRTMLLDPLVQGVRSGAVARILFPTNVVENAPQIISDLKAIFPPQEGIFLIGPMAKISWGTPALLNVSLGIVIQIPGNVAMLGKLRLALPTDDENVVLVLQLSFVGALEFDKRRLWFFASLFESRVLFITLEGEMGLLLDFGDNPNFVMSVGGFHPRFPAPPLPFPSPTRLALSIVNESYAKVRGELYFAVTSNSVQIGCRADAFFGFDSLSVTGFFSFDALLRFSPFYFIVEISAGFSVKVFGVGLFGVHLRASLEGPTPWHINGSAEISLLFFSIDVDVDVTFGERRAETLPPIEVLPRIRDEFTKLDSWRVLLPGSSRLFVSLRDLGARDALVLHPLGTLEISQRFAPLNLTLDKIGNQKPSDVKRVALGVATAALEAKGPAREKFAVAQYREMSDDAKLSAPAYEPLDSGVRLGVAGQPWATGRVAQRTVRYETIIIDTAYRRFRRRYVKLLDGLFAHFRRGAAVSRASVSLANEQRLQPFASKIAIEEDRFTLANQTDNSAYVATAFGSYAEAAAHLDQMVSADPSLADRLHVIPHTEARRAA
jgi:hypothetical protein